MNAGDGITTRSILATPEVAEVSDEFEVTDLRHPLYGRRFRVHSATGGDASTARVYVHDSKGRRLMILREATRLSVLGRGAPSARLNTSAVEEFLALVKEYELCPSPPATSGADSLPASHPKDAATNVNS